MELDKLILKEESRNTQAFAHHPQAKHRCLAAKAGWQTSESLTESRKERIPSSAGRLVVCLVSILYLLGNKAFYGIFILLGTFYSSPENAFRSIAGDFADLIAGGSGDE